MELSQRVQREHEYFSFLRKYPEMDGVNIYNNTEWSKLIGSKKYKRYLDIKNTKAQA